jgi:putative transcriptional regulator
MSKKNKLFTELKDALNESLEHAQGKRELRTTRVPLPPKKRKPKDIVALRKRLNVSQAVFAKGLNVSVKTVQSWEQGLKKPSGAALKLLAITEKAPAIVFDEFENFSV